MNRGGPFSGVVTMNRFCWLAIVLAALGLCGLAAASAAEVQAGRSDKDRAAAIRAGKQSGADPKFVAAIRRLDQLFAEL